MTIETNPQTSVLVAPSEEIVISPDTTNSLTPKSVLTDSLAPDDNMERIECKISTQRKRIIKEYARFTNTTMKDVVQMIIEKYSFEEELDEIMRSADILQAELNIFKTLEQTLENVG